MSPHHLELLALCAMPTEFDAGQMVLREGEPASGFYLLETGTVALEGKTEDGRKVVIGRAMAYQRTGQLARSLALMDRAVETKPAEPDLWLFRGRYRVEGGDCSGATNDVDRAIALAPANASAYSARGVARLCAGDRAGARAAFERSLRIDPEQPNVRNYLATLR